MSELATRAEELVAALDKQEALHLSTPSILIIEQALLAERRLAADLLSSHIHKFVDTPDDGFITGYGICSCGEAKADGVTIYATIWRNHLREVVERAAAEKEVGE